MSDELPFSQRAPGVKELLMLEALEARFVSNLALSIPRELFGARVEGGRVAERERQELAAEAWPHHHAAPLRLQPRGEIFYLVISPVARDMWMDFERPLSAALSDRPWSEVDKRHTSSFVAWVAAALGSAWATPRSPVRCDASPLISWRQAVGSLPGTSTFRQRAFVAEKGNSRLEWEVITVLSTVRLR